MRQAHFEIPVHRALSEPVLLAGVPRAGAILIGTLAAALGLGLRMWLVGALFWLVSHGLAVWLTKRDPAFLEVARRHLKHRSFLTC
jgi:type IV secretory pathway TrbD component